MKDLRVIIVEDEDGAATNLRLLLKEIAPGIEVMAVLPGVEQATEWLAENKHPDLAFFDIQLEDGLSFEIFNNLEIDFPVIFTTAFDQYAIQAFKVNSIDYLLKPIKDEELLRALKKYEQLNKKNIDSGMVQKLLDAIASPAQSLQTFLVHFKDKIIPLPASEIAFFYIGNGVVHGCTHSNQNYPIEHTLDELEASLDKKLFFRANRQFIVNRKGLKDAEIYFNGRLLLNMQPASPENILISKVRVPVFKGWLKG